jgi:DNA-directed RNA polymerase specialized sigma24 family protein
MAKQKHDKDNILLQAGTLFSELPQSDRAVLQATGSYKEAAATLGIPVGTYKSRQNRALHRLQKMIAVRGAQDEGQQQEYMRG